MGCKTWRVPSVLWFSGIIGLLAWAETAWGQTTPAECVAICRNNGYLGVIEFCTYPVHRPRIEVRERFEYVGWPEGHDCGSNLLQGCRGPWSPTPSVCNVSRGTCQACDEGCGLIGIACSGRVGEPVCCSGQACVGEWSSSGVGPWRPYGQSSYVHVRSTAPADCDCVEIFGSACNTGYRGAADVCSYNGEFCGIGKYSIQQCVSDAGCMYHRGWDGTAYVDRGCLCGILNINGWCSVMGVVITSTISQSLMSGDPNFYIPPGPACYPCC